MDFIKWLERLFTLPKDLNSLSDVLSRLLGLARKAVTAQQIENFIGSFFTKAGGAVSGLVSELIQGALSVAGISPNSAAGIAVAAALNGVFANAEGQTVDKLESLATAAVLNALGIAQSRAELQSIVEANPELPDVLQVLAEPDWPTISEDVDQMGIPAHTDPNDILSHVWD